MRESSTKNRRSILKALAAGTATTLAGCAGDTSSSSGGTTGGSDKQTSSSTAEKQGGNFRIADTVTVTSLDGLVADGKGEWILLGNLNSMLTQMKPDLSVGPELATDWESNENNTQWKFHLRGDATWHHNDNKVLAEDVVATAEAIHAEESGAQGKGNLGPFDNAEVINDKTVQFNLNDSDALIPRRWAAAFAPIYPKDVVRNRREEMATKDFGSGPFTLEEYSSGDQTVLTAYEDYYGADKDGNQLPYLDKFTLKNYPDTSSLVTAYQNNDIDLLWKVPRSQWSRIKNKQNTESAREPAAAFPIIDMRVTEPPFDDNRVRTAFKLAVDRKGLLTSGASGLGEVAYDHPVGPSYPLHADLEAKRSQDLKRAEQLLQEAGYGKGGEAINLDFKTTTSPSYVSNTTVAAAEQFNKLPNVQINVVQQSYDTYISNTWTKATFYTSWYSQRPTASTILALVFTSDGAWNETGFADEEFDQAVAKTSSASTKKERKEAVRKCEQILFERGPAIVPFYRDMLNSWHKYTHGYEPNPMQKYIDGETVWLDGSAPTKK